MRVLGTPRQIDPSLIEIGDTIQVKLPASDGVVTVLYGTVASRRDHGSVRILSTAEGGTLLSWEPGRKDRSVTLIDRPPVDQEPLALFG